VNAALLYARQRPVVQFDVTYYDKPIVRKTVTEFASQLTDVVVRHDSSNNIVVYLTSAAPRIEARLKQRDGTVEGGFQSTTFALMLDGQFYVCTDVVGAVLQRPGPVRVGIHVIAGRKKTGAILVQMCGRHALRPHVSQLYARLLSISRALEKLDPQLQTELTFYTKPGMWKESPEYVPHELYELPP
tara:strand:+ start:737 stop:1297 length:561 start_codon:yes stop_codon:yes gene_type:complete